MSEIKNNTHIEKIEIQNEAEDSLSYQNNVVTALIEQGLPATFSPNNFISKIAQQYNIGLDDARECLKSAVNYLEQNTPKKIRESYYKEAEPTKEPEEKNKNAYFWDYGYNTNSKKPDDGMNSLTSLSDYNRLIFGL